MPIQVSEMASRVLREPVSCRFRERKELQQLAAATLTSAAATAPCSIAVMKYIAAVYPCH